MNKRVLILFVAGIAFYSCSPKKISTAIKSTENQSLSLVNNESVTSTNSFSLMVGNAAEGQQIYSTKCNTCHGFKNPAHFTVKEWGPIMKRMALKANLSELEKSNVTAYALSKAKS